MKALLTCFIILSFNAFSFTPKDKVSRTEVSSPNKDLQVKVSLQSGVAYYQVTRNRQSIIVDSKLGFTLKDAPALSGDFAIIDTKLTAFDETWTQPWGEVKEIRNQYNSLSVTLQEQSTLKRILKLEFRVFNDGVGFRYDIPQQPNLKDFIILDEHTEFAMAQNLDVWWIPAYHNDIDSECLFQKNKIADLKEIVHTPLTMEGSSTAVSIHEAALIDYAAMTLQKQNEQTLKCDLVAWANGDRVVTSAPMHTPWRTIQIAATPEALITSYLILNLNEPNKLGDVSWVKPGKYNGIWWGMHLQKHTWEGGPKHGATTQNMKTFIDFASSHKLSAVLAEGWNEGWEGEWPVHGNFSFTKAYPDYDLAELSRYAREKNIGLIAHHETGGNVKNYEAQLEDAFKLCAQYDIHRLKTGYVNKRPAGERHQNQYMVRHYQKVLETAARYKVMLDVHEPVKDTGLRRTYPNMMTREGARGNEYEAWSTGNPPDHTTILPFTRCLSGPLDYTPGIFDIRFKTTGNFRVHTTLAKQLALYVVIYSPFQMAADLPENYEGKPAFKFIEDVPTDWEVTKVLDSKIGDYATIVRKDRNSSDWYLGSITDEESRTLSIGLDFLQAEKKYTAEIYQDGQDADMETNPASIELKTIPVDSKTVLPIRLAPGGGTAIRFIESK